MKKTILIILSLAVLMSCNQSADPHKRLLEILEISQKETLTSEDYHKIVQLTEQDTVGFDKYLEAEGITFDVKVQLMDAIYEDVFNTLGDTTALERRLEICRWIKDNYQEYSREVKIAESRLIEIYTYWGKYDMAIEQLNRNLSGSKGPSLDHATCIYTKGWLELQMNKRETALNTLQESLYEYEFLVNWAKDTLEKETLDEEHWELLKTGQEEAQKGIEDCLNLINEIESGQ